MNASQIRQAVAIAKDSNIDLSTANDAVLFGCACSDFKPVYVDLNTVAKLMRWQYLCFDGSWDHKLFNDELWAYRKNIKIVG